MALYKTWITVDIVVEANNKYEAEDVAKDHLAEELQNTIDRSSLNMKLVSQISELPPGWKDAIPWGDDKDDKTCEETLNDVRSRTV